MSETDSGSSPVRVARTYQDPTLVAAILVGTAFLLAAGLRLIRLGTSADLFVDEFIYRDMGHSVASGGFPHFEGPFFLHPPGFFYLESFWEDIFGYRSDAISGVYEMRALNAVLAGATAAALVVLVLRASRSLAAAAAVGLLFSVDSFALRQNGRVLLETAMMLFVVLGYVLLIRLAEHPLPATPRIRAAGAGLFFGLAVLVKDEAVIITVLPLLVAMALRWGVERSLLLTTVLATVSPYCVYLVVVAANGQWGLYWSTKMTGIARLLGIEQSTGFNANGAPSLTGRLAAELGSYGASYAVLLAGGVGVGWLMFRAMPAQRLLGLFHLSAGLLLVYSVALGTLEEHSLYVLYIPTLASLTVAASVWVRRRHGRGHAMVSPAGVGTVVCLGLVLGFSGLSYVSGRLQPDDGYARLRAYMARHVVPGTAVSSVYTAFGTADGVLQDRYTTGSWVTPEDRANANVKYLVVPWKEVREGYSDVKLNTVQSLVDQARLVFSFEERTYGSIALYELPLPPSADSTSGPGQGGH